MHRRNKLKHRIRLIGYVIMLIKGLSKDVNKKIYHKVRLIGTRASKGVYEEEGG